MSLSIKEIQLAVGDPGSDAWLEVHHAANRAVWGDAAQRTSIEEVVDVTARRHEVRRTFVAEDASSRIHEHSGARRRRNGVRAGERIPADAPRPASGPRAARA